MDLAPFWQPFGRPDRRTIRRSAATRAAAAGMAGLLSVSGATAPPAPPRAGALPAYAAAGSGAELWALWAGHLAAGNPCAAAAARRELGRRGELRCDACGTVTLGAYPHMSEATLAAAAEWDYALRSDRAVAAAEGAHGAAMEGVFALSAGA